MTARNRLALVLLRGVEGFCSHTGAVVELVDAGGRHGCADCWMIARAAAVEANAEIWDEMMAHHRGVEQAEVLVNRWRRSFGVICAASVQADIAAAISALLVSWRHASGEQGSATVPGDVSARP